eukprot:3722912-Rhodomonas_salina.2
MVMTRKLTNNSARRNDHHSDHRGRFAPTEAPWDFFRCSDSCAIDAGPRAVITAFKSAPKYDTCRGDRVILKDPALH